MSIWRMLKSTEQLNRTVSGAVSDTGKVSPDAPSGAEPEVFAFVEVVRDNPDKARSLVRALSGQDRAVLSFHLSELSRLVEEEETFRTTADRRTARLSAEEAAYPDGYDT